MTQVDYRGYFKDWTAHSRTCRLQAIEKQTQIVCWIPAVKLKTLKVCIYTLTVETSTSMASNVTGRVGSKPLRIAVKNGKVCLFLTVFVLISLVHTCTFQANTNTRNLPIGYVATAMRCSAEREK